MMTAGKKLMKGDEFLITGQSGQRTRIETAVATKATP